MRIATLTVALTTCLAWIGCTGPGQKETVNNVTPFAWYRAGESQSATGASAQPGDRVARLLDQSGNGRDLFVEGPEGRGPMLREDVVTGAPLLAFSGEEYLQSADGWELLTQPSTLIFAVRIIRTSGGHLFDSRDGTEGRQAMFAGDSTRLSRWQLWAGEGLIHDELAMTHHMEIHSIVLDGERTEHHINRQLVAAGSAGKQALSGLTLGARHDLAEGYFLHGEIGEVMIFRGVLPADERQSIEAELKDRYLPRDLIDVFVSGTDGYHTYRIPVLLATRDGTLLAFAEGRSRRTDQSKNNIVLRRSEDGGETWQPIVTIADHGDHALNDPTVVQDGASGRIFLFFHEYPFGHHAGNIAPGFEGEGLHRTFLVLSDDDGVTWSETEDITRSVKRSEDVTYLGSGPGIGIQLEAGAHAGRLVIPFRERSGVFSVFSDDGGTTWVYGNLAENISPGMANEPQMVEVGNGHLLLNARNAGGLGTRKIALSEDGGMTWGVMWHDDVLIEPECQASLIRTRGVDGEEVLLFLNPASREKGDGGRVRGLLRASFDGGQTWPSEQMIYPGQFSYSAMAVMGERDLGILFERDFGLYWLRQRATDHGKDPMRISFQRVSLEKLLEAADR